MKTKSRLTPLQARFIDEYLVDLNGTQAAIRAGYRGKRPEVYASKLLAMPHIKAEVQRRMDRRQARTEITQDYVLEVIKEQVERHRYSTDTERGRLVMIGADKLGAHLGMWKTKHEHTGANGKPLAPPVIGITFSDGGPGAPAPANDDGVETSG